MEPAFARHLIVNGTLTPEQLERLRSLGYVR